VRTGETMPAASRATLRALGVWTTFLGDGHLPCPGISSWWGPNTPVQQDSAFDPSGPGWHVDRCRFDRMLVAAAAATGAEVLDDTRLLDSQFTAGMSGSASWSVALQRDGRRSTCGARVLIIATGRSTAAPPEHAVRDRLDRLIGLGAIVPSDAVLSAADQRIWIEATPCGWWYSAPMANQQWTFTFFTDADQAPTRRAAQPLKEYWVTRLALAPNTTRRIEALGLRASALAMRSVANPVTVIAADSYRKRPCHGPGWLAAGDAASAWDPLSGQGIEKALRSGLRAAAAVDAMLGTRDCDAAALTAYARSEEEIDRQYRAHFRTYYGQ